jgi:IS4 transposase
MTGDIYSFNTKSLYLHRGFFNVPVIRWLKALNIPFIMPAIRRGKKKGIKQFLKGKSSYKIRLTMSRGPDDDVTFDLWIVCKYRKGKRKKRGVEYFAYVVYNVKVNLSYVHQDYRKRFGIESSYRLKNVCRIRTNNKKPALRLLFVGLSFLLINIWVYLLWFKVSHPRKGKRLVFSKLFGLKQMLAFLRQVIEQKYLTARNIYIPSNS